MKTALVICSLMFSSFAFAQDYGLTVGVHQTTAAVDGGAGSAYPAGSVNARLGYDLGLTASFELLPSFRFRTGVLYDLRPFEYKLASGAGTVGFNFSYIDIPVNVQYNFTPMFGVY